MKAGSLFSKLAVSALLLAVLVYFLIQIGGYFSDPLVTVAAYEYQVEDTVSVSGYVVRQEEVLADSGTGVPELRRSEGEKVGAGQVVAVVYKDQSALDVQEQIRSLTGQLEQLQYAQDAALSSEVSLRLDSDILHRITELRRSLSEDKLISAEDTASELKALVLKRSYTYKEGEDLSGAIAELEGQIKSLKASATAASTVITAQRAGTYSAVVDGYEAVLTPESLETMTIAQLRAVEPEVGASSRVGKLIYGDKWYFAASMPTEEVKSLGSTVTLRFTKGLDTPFRVSVESVGAEENGRVPVVFSSRKYLAEVTLLRQQSADVIKAAYEGLRVPRGAVRVDETGQTGVYCLVGVTARFKPVNVIYTGEEFCLITAASDADRTRLRTGDQVILSAAELYDGKVVGVS